MATFENVDLYINKFKVIYQRNQPKGYLTYNYAPLRNLRINKDLYKYNKNTGFYIDINDNPIYYTKDKNTIYVTKNNIDEIVNTLKDAEKTKVSTNYDSIKWAANGEEILPNHLVIEHYAGDLTEFRTDKLNLDLNHPVDIEAQESYDGSVNLILNDDLNNPRLINTRFTAKENGMYEIVDRTGNNDTNIYDEENFDSETKLYKISNNIPVIALKSIESGGQMQVGNYVFYFKYQDADGNETDFIGESGIVSIFKGYSPLSTKTYIGNYVTDKLVSFTLSNVDNAYDYITVYYTKSTSNESETELTSAYKIAQTYPINKNSCDITITGIEKAIEISLNEINSGYNIVSEAKTQTQVQSRLFLGNVNKPTIPYNELKDLSLRIYPTIYQEEDIGYLNQEYVDISNSKNKNEYFNPLNIYYRLGYWEDIYQFGVVYILNDYTLSPVFPVLGVDFKNIDNPDQKSYININNFNFDIYKEEKRNYLSLDNNGFIINEDKLNNRLNGNGVCRLKTCENINIIDSTNNKINPIGIKFNFHNSEILINELKKYTKGFFIVRRKRVPTKLCQGLTIGLDENSHLPMIPISYEEKDNEYTYMIESFLDNNCELVHTFNDRLRYSTTATPKASIIPEAELNSELYSQLFSSTEYILQKAKNNIKDKYFITSNIERAYYINSYDNYDNSNNSIYKNITLTYVKDGIQLIASSKTEFSSKAGTAEEAFRYSQLEKEDSSKSATNLIRGEWGSYVGIDGFNNPLTMFDVLISGYDENKMDEYFIARSNSNEPFFAISDRIDYNSIIFKSENDELVYSLVCYRGDCFIGNYTHRMCRNFQDPEAPNNDKIVKPSTWKDNYSGYNDGAIDTEKAAEINRGDVNAVKIGHWITFKCLSNINFASRVEDDSNSSEVTLVGHPRTFVPASWFDASGEYKVPESTLFNSGYNSTTSDKYNYILPDIPYIKNEFSNRIMYSDINISDAFKNNYRTFQISNYKDYSREFGFITYITEWYGNLLVVFEHGIGILPINERVQVAGGENSQVYLNSNNVLPERPIMISKTFGSQWKDSCVKTEFYLYGVDTVAKKIWRTNGKQIELISDFKIQTFLNDNITLTEKEITPLVGVRNVKSHFNAFKYDIMFTFYDDIYTTDNFGNTITCKEWNMCFNEKLNLWTTRFSWIPLVSENINNIFFTYDKNSAKNISSISSSWKNGDAQKSIVLDNCYTKEILTGTDWEGKETYYLSKVMYPGIEIPLADLQSGEDVSIPIGLLYSNTNIDDATKKYKLIYKLKSLEDSENDNKFFDIKTFGNNNILVFYPNKTFDHPIYGKGITYTEYLKHTYILKIDLESSLTYEGTTVLGTPVDKKLFSSLYVRLSSIGLTEDESNIIQKYESTQFWKHGTAGLIDNETDLDEYKIQNCRWYGKLEPFEFEFIVNAEPGRHKMFDNLQIISNNVQPSQIEYSIIGDSYWFYPYKKDSFEYQKYNKIPTGGTENKPKYLIKCKDKFYYLYDEEHYLTENGFISDSELGETEFLIPDSEILKDRKLNQYYIKKYMDIKNIEEFGNVVGNCKYKEDLFYIEIDPIIIDKLTVINDDIETSLEYQEIRPKDKYIKIRVKYYPEQYHKNYKEDDSVYSEGYNYNIKYEDDKYTYPELPIKMDKPIITALQTIYTNSYN